MENPQQINRQLFEELHNKALKRLEFIMAQREEILEAFIAKHGCDPDEVEQVEMHDPSNVFYPKTWFVRKKSNARTQ